MAFTPATNVTIVGKGDRAITLFVPEVIDAEHPRTGEIEIQLKMSDGSIKVIKADLLARLADDATGLMHRANLLAMMTYIDGRIDAEVLP